MLKSEESWKPVKVVERSNKTLSEIIYKVNKKICKKD